MDIQLQELIKLGLQFAGALAIARLTVTWALSRFKTEKAWERKIASMAEVLSALREMVRVLSIQEDRHLRHAEDNEEYENKLRERWQAAKLKFEAVSAVAILILPQEAADRIQHLEDKLANAKHESWFDEIQHDYAAVAECMTWLIDHAKDYRS